MPIQRCTLKNRKKGWKFGKSGKCYSNKKDALKQMKAMFASGYRGK